MKKILLNENVHFVMLAAVDKSFKKKKTKTKNKTEKELMF